MTKYDTKGAFEALREDPFLPPVPAPRKSRKGWYIAGAVVVVLGIGSAVSQNSTTENPTTPVAGSVIDEPVVQETTIGEAADQSVPLLNDASQELDAGLVDFKAYDVNGAADHLDNVGDDYATVSAIWFGVDQYVSDTNSEVANEMYAAADDLRAVRIGSSTRHMNNATALIQDMTAYTDTLA